MSEAPILGIITCDGPAPGLNGVIASATIFACQIGWKVLGFHDGFLHFASEDEQEVRDNILELTAEKAMEISLTGGSVLRSDRYDPTRNCQNVTNVLEMIRKFKIRYLLVLGGNHKMTATHLITQGVDPEELQIIVIPKTIDNDIQLPPEQSTFGYHSARAFGALLVKGLMRDSRSMPQWYAAEISGRRAGHLALSIADATGAHLAIIPEDFISKKIDFSDICDIFEGAIIKRLAFGKEYGVCTISEALVSQLNNQSLKYLQQAGYLEMTKGGQYIQDDAEISRAITEEVRRWLAEHQINIQITPISFNYELRSCPPNDFDLIYSQELGYGAIQGFLDHHSNCMVVWENGKISFQSFRSMMHTTTNEITPRRVDPQSESYKCSRESQWQIKRRDLEDEAQLAKMTEIAHMTKEEFIAKFGHVVSITN